MKRVALALMLCVGLVGGTAVARASDERLQTYVKSLPQPKARYTEGSLISTCTPSDDREPNCGQRPLLPDPIIRPTDAPAEDYNARGVAFLEEGLIDKAISDFDKAIEMRPDFAEAFNNRGNARIASGRFDLALADFDQALRIKSKLTAVHFNRAKALNALQRYTEAIAELDTYLDELPNDRDALLNRAFAYRQLQVYGLSLADLATALKLSPRDPVVLNARCWTRAIAGVELLGALRDCNEALSVRPDHCQTLDSRGLVAFRLGRYRQAIDDNSAAVKVNPEQASSFYIRGLAELRLGRKQAGIADIAAAKALDPLIESTYEAYGVKPDVDAKVDPYQSESGR